MVPVDGAGNGSYTITTSGSNFDTLMDVYTGTAFGTRHVVGSNDDAGTSVDQQRHLLRLGGDGLLHRRGWIRWRDAARSN